MPRVHPPLAAEVGRVLEAHRETAGVTRRAMARELGVTEPTLLELEKGRANPTLARLEGVASAYGLELVISARPIRGGGRMPRPTPATAR